MPFSTLFARALAPAAAVAMLAAPAPAKTTGELAQVEAFWLSATICTALR